jgi:hypothetical protein
VLPEPIYSQPCGGEHAAKKPGRGSPRDQEARQGSSEKHPLTVWLGKSCPYLYVFAHPLNRITPSVHGLCILMR